MAALLLMVGLRWSDVHACAASPAAHTATSLSIGTPSLVDHDPLHQLALDLAEHLPAQAGPSADGDPSPMPLHPPLSPDSNGVGDELQGADLSATVVPLGRHAPAAVPARPQHGTDFASTDARRHERPPASSVSPQP